MSKSLNDESQQIETDSHFIRELVRQMYKENRIERCWAIFIRLVRAAAFVVISVAVFIAANRPNLFPRSAQEDIDDHIALIQIKGELSSESASSADRLIPVIKRAFEHKNTQAVVLRINSPGGSAVQAGLIYDEILAQRQLHPDKPVFAVIEDIGASGGYYIAVAAEQIFANRASLVGSIGVISSGFGFADLIEKIGIERRTITAGSHKDFLDPFTPMTQEIKQFWEDVLSQTHKQFVDRVKANRADKLSADTELFSGLIWNGAQAKELGLVDDLKSTEAVARDIVGISNIIDYTPKIDLFTRIAGKAVVQAVQAIQQHGALKFSY